MYKDEYQVTSIKLQEARDKSQEPRSQNRLRIDFFASLRLCERKEERNESQELRAEKQEPFAHRFLCVFAALRAKIKMLENEPSLLAL
jgi:hypothetical protein